METWSGCYYVPLKTRFFKHFITALYAMSKMAHPSAAVSHRVLLP